MAQEYPRQWLPDSPVSRRGSQARHTYPVRVIEYTVTDSTGNRGPEVFRLITTILDPEDVTAAELAAYQQRWVRHEVAWSEWNSQKEDRFMSVT